MVQAWVITSVSEIPASPKPVRMRDPLPTSPHLLTERFLLMDTKTATWADLVMVTTPFPSPEFSLSKEIGSAPVFAICFVGFV